MCGGILILTHVGAITKNKRQDVFVRATYELKKHDIKGVGLIAVEAISARKHVVGIDTSCVRELLGTA